jgi:RND family efflux transporter MFP subunit
VAVEVVRPVKTQQIIPARKTRERTFSGAAKAGVESNLSFRVGGSILDLAVDVGDRVQTGDLIAELDQTDFQLNVKVAEAALDQARAQLKNAEANLGRIRNLFENDNASQSDYDTAETARNTAEAALRSLERRLELSKQQLVYTRLLAPQAGAISQVLLEVNENVTPGQTVAVLTSGIRPEVEVAVAEQYIAEIRPQSRVRVRFDAIREANGERAFFEARVSEVGVAANRYSPTFPVTVQLLKSDRRVLPGMAAEVVFSFVESAGSSRYLLPTHAVGEDRDGRFVFVVKPVEGDVGVVERRAVEVGDLVSAPDSAMSELRGYIELITGVSEGEHVVTAGLGKIEPGMKVRLIPSEAG